MKQITLAALAPGFLAACLLAAAPQALRAQVEFKNIDNDHIAISINGQPFSDFCIGSAYPKPFLAPLRSATGLIVTRKFPMENVEGETRDHPHHRGLFVGYGDVSNVNFWETERESKASGDNPTTKGLIVLEKLGELKPGKKSGSITASFTWQAPDRGTMIEEQQTLTFYAEHDLRTEPLQLERIEGLDRPLRADRHEDGGADRPVRRLERRRPREAVRGIDREVADHRISVASPSEKKR